MAKKETIVPPSKRELKNASSLLRKGSSAGGRVMVEKRVANREGVKRGR